MNARLQGERRVSVMPAQAGIQTCENALPIGRLAFPGKAETEPQSRRGILPRSVGTRTD